MLGFNYRKVEVSWYGGVWGVRGYRAIFLRMGQMGGFGRVADQVVVCSGERVRGTAVAVADLQFRC